MGQVELALKSGRIVFPWRQVALWLKPTPLTVTPNADTAVELPLKVVAPLFIAQHKPSKAQKKLSLGENIPDVFSGGQPLRPTAAVTTDAYAPPAAPVAPAPRVAPAPAPAPAPRITPAPAPAPPPPAAPSFPAPKPIAPAAPAAPAPAPAKQPTTMGEVFGQPAKKDWAPHEIVQKASALKGMSGAIIATNDGLLVAGQVSGGVGPDTVAAFLPQIFGRLNTYGKELHVGELNSLTLEFQKVPWQVVKLGTLFFAAIGKAGESLPVSLLTVITNELAKQTR